MLAAPPSRVPKRLAVLTLCDKFLVRSESCGKLPICGVERSRRRRQTLRVLINSQ